MRACQQAGIDVIVLVSWTSRGMCVSVCARASSIHPPHQLPSIPTAATYNAAAASSSSTTHTTTSSSAPPSQQPASKAGGGGNHHHEPLSDEFRARVRALGERLGVPGAVGEGQEALVTLQVSKCV